MHVSFWGDIGVNVMDLPVYKAPCLPCFFCKISSLYILTISSSLISIHTQTRQSTNKASMHLKTLLVALITTLTTASASAIPDSLRTLKTLEKQEDGSCGQICNGPGSCLVECTVCDIDTSTCVSK